MAGTQGSSIDPSLFGVVGAPTLGSIGDGEHADQEERGILSGLDSLAGVAGGVGAGNGGAGVKRKKEGDPAVKRTRQSQSCDACRARKVKCDRPPPGSQSSLPPKDVCSHCKQLDLPCTFDYKPKKRGPPNLYVKRMQRAQTSTSTPGLESPGIQLPVSTPGETSPSLPLPPPRQDPSIRTPLEPSYIQSRVPGSGSGSGPGSGETEWRRYSNGHDAGAGPGPGLGTLSAQNAVQASALHNQGQGLLSRIGRDVDEAWDDALLSTLAATRPSESSAWSSTTPIRPPPPHGSPGQWPNATTTTHISPQAHTGQTGTGLTAPSPSFSTPPYASLPHNPSNPLEAILPRGFLYHIVDLFFDYIYCLTPCLHRPSFMRDLHAKREERPGEEEWTAMVLSLVAATLVQLPRAFVPMPRSEVKALVQKCYRHVTVALLRDYQDVSIDRHVTLYFAGLIASLLGHDLAGRELFAANVALLLYQRLNEENTYHTFNPIQRELRRRIFWLAYGGDRSVGAVDGGPMLFNEDDCADLALPAEIDDEYFTEDGYLPQPKDKTPILSGFYYISKLFRLCGQVIDKRRRDRRRPPTGLMLQMRLNEVDEIFDRIMGLMDDCPEPLKLDADGDNRSIASFSDDWDTHASADIRQLFLDPKASKAMVKDAYLVQQANIYVTQQMVRYMVLQYRDELISLLQAEIAQGSREAPSNTARRHSSGRRAERSILAFSEEEKDQVMTDLLVILQRIPIQVIAVNSLPLVWKVRFVASTLLDALATPSVSAAPSPGPSKSLQKTQRAQSYLWDFLRILSEIEALYAMTDNATPAGA